MIVHRYYIIFKSLWRKSRIVWIVFSLAVITFLYYQRFQSKWRVLQGTCSESRLRVSKQLNIFVYSPGFSQNCGGCTVLHYLVDRVNVWFDDQLVTAYIVPMGYPAQRDIVVNSAYKTPVIPEWIDIQDGFVIYPEIIFGNPLGVESEKIIRWILYFPGVHGGPPASNYSTHETIVCYSMGICQDFTPSHSVSLLKITDYGLDMLRYLPSGHCRKGTLVHHKKRKWKSGQVQDVPKIDGEPLNNTITKFDRLVLFSRAEKFITTDPATFLSVEAAAAGCLSIVEPLENVSRDEWLRTAYSAADLKYGIAYGEKEIPYAIKTLPLVLRNLVEQQANQRKRLEQFLSMLVERL